MTSLDSILQSGGIIMFRREALSDFRMISFLKKGVRTDGQLFVCNIFERPRLFQQLLQAL